MSERHEVAEYGQMDAFTAAVARGERDPWAAVDRFNERALVAVQGQEVDEYPGDPEARAGHVMHELACHVRREEMREHQQRLLRDRGAER